MLNTIYRDWYIKNNTIVPFPAISADTEKAPVRLTASLTRSGGQHRPRSETWQWCLSTGCRQSLFSWQLGSAGRAFCGGSPWKLEKWVKIHFDGRKNWELETLGRCSLCLCHCFSWRILTRLAVGWIEDTMWPYDQGTSTLYVKLSFLWRFCIRTWGTSALVFQSAAKRHGWFQRLQTMTRWNCRFWGPSKIRKKKKNTTETAIGTHHQDIVPSHFGIFGWENSTVRPFRPWLFLTAKLSFPWMFIMLQASFVSDQKNRSASCKSIVHCFVFHDFRWFQSHPVENKIRLYPFLVGGFNPSEKYESQLGWLYGKIVKIFETTAPRFVCGSKPWYPQYPEITDEWMVKNPNRSRATPSGFTIRMCPK